MDAIEVKVDNLNLIEVEFDPERTDIEIAANFNPVIEVKDFDYPQELAYINQRISQILQANGNLVEWNKSATHIQYRYAGDEDWIDLVALSEIKGESGYTPQKGVDYFDGAPGYTPQKGVDYFDGEKGDPQTRDGLGLGENSTPLFANTFNTALNTNVETGGEMTPTLWAWIQSVYSAIVPKSVKSHITGLWTYGRSLASRIGALEDSYILKYIVPADVTTVELTVDRYGNALNFTEGQLIQIYLKLEYLDEGIPYIRLNNNSNQIYLNSNGMSSVLVIGTINRKYWTVKADIVLISGEFIGTTNSNYYTSTTYNSSVYNIRSIGFNSSSINSIRINLSATIKAGSTILIKKK